MRSFSNILVTGGAGFIGSHVIRQILNHHPIVKVVNLDLLTYAGNLENLADIELNFQSSGRYTFVKGDICNKRLLKELFIKKNWLDSMRHLFVRRFEVWFRLDRSVNTNYLLADQMPHFIISIDFTWLGFNSRSVML